MAIADIDDRIPAYEQQLQAFLAARGTDIDAQTTMFLLYRTNTDTIAAMERSLRPHGLTHAGFVLLMTLWTTGPKETRHLAKVLRVSKPAVVGVVDTLERAGFVRRVRSEEDRRLVSVELTREGGRTIEAAQRDWHRCERVIAGALSEREQRTLARVLRKLGDAARSGGCVEVQ